MGFLDNARELAEGAVDEAQALVDERREAVEGEL